MHEKHAEIEDMAIYLDYNATTPLDSSVCSVIKNSFIHWANPSSNYPTGVEAKKVISEARKYIASMINVRAEDIIFTSGGTEANNMVIFGVLHYFKDWLRDRDSTRYCEKPHVITTNVEHDSVALPLKHLQKKGEIGIVLCRPNKYYVGLSLECLTKVSVQSMSRRVISSSVYLTIVPVLSRGCITKDDILCEVRRSTCLITVMLANNETGVIMPLEEIGRSLKEINKRRKEGNEIVILLHTDAAQAIGKIPVDADVLQVDYMTIVGHKFYGPRIGCLYAREMGHTTPVYPLLHGGGQEWGSRPGTENTQMIAGLGEAARLVCKNLDQYSTHMAHVRNYLEAKLKETFEGEVKINCSTEVKRLPNTCNMSFCKKDLIGHVVLSKCSNIMASVGAACHAQNKPSGVLIASGVPHSLALNAIRLSVGRETSKSDIDVAVTDLQAAVLNITREYNS